MNDNSDRTNFIVCNNERPPRTAAVAVLTRTGRYCCYKFNLRLSNYLVTYLTTVQLYCRTWKREQLISPYTTLSREIQFLLQ